MEKRRPAFPAYLLIPLALLVLLLVMLLRYASGSLLVKEPPQIAVTAEGRQLSWVVAKNAWDGSKYDREPTFVLYEKEGLLPSQLAEGGTVTVAMDGLLPDEVALEEFALSPSGQAIYGEAVPVEEHNFYFDGRAGTFTLPEGGDSPVRGYLMTCSWGENVCEYAVVVQLVPGP